MLQALAVRSATREILVSLTNFLAFWQLAASSASRRNQAWRATTLSRSEVSPGLPSQADAR
jgi:hypothetical protein